MSGASAELRPKFTEFVRREGFLETLVPSLFHLMPKRAFEAATDAANDEKEGEGALTELLKTHKVSCGLFDCTGISAQLHGPRKYVVKLDLGYKAI